MRTAVAPADLRQDKLLATRKARLIIARLDAATDEAYPERDTHIRQITLTVLNAKGIR